MLGPEVDADLAVTEWHRAMLVGGGCGPDDIGEVHATRLALGIATAHGGDYAQHIISSDGYPILARRNDPMHGGALEQRR